MSKDRDTSILRQAPEPPAYLAGRILRRIAHEEQQNILRQIVVSGVLLVVSLAASIASVLDLGTNLSRSGFLSFISLFGSDFSFAVTNMKEISLSLMESFPALSAAFFVASAALVLWFGMRLVKEAVIVRRNGFAVR